MLILGFDTSCDDTSCAVVELSLIHISTESADGTRRLGRAIGEHLEGSEKMCIRDRRHPGYCHYHRGLWQDENGR